MRKHVKKMDEKLCTSDVRVTHVFIGKTLHECARRVTIPLDEWGRQLYNFSTMLNPHWLTPCNMDNVIVLALSNYPMHGNKY
jgi:hypothetical protein